jgi:hypothetical protein
MKRWQLPCPTRKPPSLPSPGISSENPILHAREYSVTAQPSSSEWRITPPALLLHPKHPVIPATPSNAQLIWPISPMLQSVTVQAPGCLFPSCKNIAARQDVKGLDIVNAGKGRAVRIEGPGLRASAMPGVSRRKGRQKKKALPSKNRKSKKPKALLPEMQPETIPRHNCERRREKRRASQT